MQIIPLGGITPGTSPVVVNSNLPSIKRASKVSVQSLASNTQGAHVYVGTANMNTTTLVGVMAILSPGDQFVLVDEQSTAFQLDVLYVLGENSNDIALAVAYQR